MDDNGNPVKVTGPDGKPYAFPAGTTKDAAIAYFKKKGITGKKTATDTQPTTPSRPGLIKRLGEATGAPTSKEELEGMGPTPAETLIGPGATAVRLASAFGKNAYREGKKTLGEVRESIKNIREGGPVLPNVGKAVYGVESGIMRGGPSSLVGSGAVQSFGEDVAAGNVMGATGDALGTVVNALLLKGSLGPSDATRTNKLAFAGHTDPALIENTLNDLRTSTGGKTPQTVGDFLETVNEAKRKMNTESGLAMKPIANAKIVPIDIADRIKNLVEPWMDSAPEGKVIKQKILDAAKEFESKEWTYGQLDTYRTHLQQTLSSYYNKGNVAQYAELKTDPGTAIDRAVVSGIQDAVYPQMDAAAGKPAGYFQKLKSRQSNLISLEKALNDRVEMLRTKTAQIQGGPRLGENVSLYQSHAGTPGMSIHKLQDVIVKPNPSRVANRAVRKGFRPPSPTAKAGLYTLPIRTLLLQDQEPKSPKELRDKAKELAQ